jgi:predicted CxxxxCH...CXXCH cytochrome family protein
VPRPDRTDQRLRARPSETAGEGVSWNGGERSGSSSELDQTCANPRCHSSGWRLSFRHPHWHDLLPMDPDSSTKSESHVNEVGLNYLSYVPALSDCQERVTSSCLNCHSSKRKARLKSGYCCLQLLAHTHPSAIAKGHAAGASH